MGKGRTQMTLEELVKKYTAMRLKQKKQKKPDKYAGLQECIKNVRRCNCVGKLAYY